jgi:hypothetical protein
MQEKIKKMLFAAIEISLLLIISPLIYRYVCDFCLLLLKIFKIEYGPYRWVTFATVMLCIGWIYLIARLPFLKNIYLKIALLYLLLFPSLCMLFILWYFNFVPVG